MDRRPFALALALLGAAQVGCVERQRVLTRAERRQLAEFVGTTAPRPSHPLSIRFGDAVELVGYDVSKTTWGVGSEATFTFYWHALRDVEEGYRAFTHVCDPTGRMVQGADDVGIIRRLYPVGRFRAGEYVRDVQTITLPGSFDASEVSVYLGVFDDEGRMPIARGPNDGTDRARVVTLPTGGERTTDRPLDVPRLRVARAPAPPTIDGRLDEPAWSTANRTMPLVDTLTGNPSPLQGSIRVLWDDENLYFAFEITDPFLVSPFRTRDDHLWEKDCVEIMLDPLGDGRNYFELQVNPLGTVFDTRYDSRRVPQPFGHLDFDSRLRAAAVASGTPNDGLDDEGYVVEAALPFAALEVGDPVAPRPTAGTVIRTNFYVMDTMRAGVRAAGWSAPRVGDFHFPSRFGELVLEAPR